MKTLNKFAMSWPVVVLGLISFMFYATVNLWPASYWFEVRSVRVSDGPPPPVMAVDRTIKRPFYGRWTATIRKWDGGWVIACVAQGENDYTPSAMLPQKLTLDWWTYNQCKNLGPGQYTMTTSWTIEGRGLLPDKHVSVNSNIWGVPSL